MCSVECYWHCSDWTVHYKSDKMVNFCGATMSPITVFINVVFLHFKVVISTAPCCEHACGWSGKTCACLAGQDVLLHRIRRQRDLFCWQPNASQWRSDVPADTRTWNYPAVCRRMSNCCCRKHVRWYFMFCCVWWQLNRRFEQLQLFYLSP